MNDIYKALGDIGSIRKQVANATEFRGYGPATLATTGVFAVLAAFAQHLLIGDPAVHSLQYLAIWTATASLCACLTGWQMYTRSRRIHSHISEEMIRMAAEQFLPALLAGLLVTLVVVLYVPQLLWALPALWQIVFSLGIFSSCRFLPKPVLAVAAWYLLTGLSCLALGDTRALSPWMMGAPFGVGQMLLALIFWLRGAEANNEE